MEAERILARYLRADLSPPLGKPGGPCQVVERIERNVRSPVLRDELQEDVEKGEPLSNAEAAKVYTLDRERGVGPIRAIQITHHAQYRMDLRKVTVADVQAALAGFLKQMETWKAQGNRAYENMGQQLSDGEPISWVDPRTRLKIIFESLGGGTVDVITTFWKGVPDPPPMKCPT